MDKFPGLSTGKNSLGDQGELQPLSFKDLKRRGGGG